MPDMMPQELAVWYVIPTIRRELSSALLKKGLSQKRIAKILGVTEAAVSQYLKSKRASAIKLTKDEKTKLAKTADKILKDEKQAKSLIYQLSNELMGSVSVCKIHMAQDKSLSKDCNICVK